TGVACGRGTRFRRGGADTPAAPAGGTAAVRREAGVVGLSPVAHAGGQALRHPAAESTASRDRRGRSRLIPPCRLPHPARAGQRGSRRQIGRGSSFMIENTGRSTAGTHTVCLRARNALTVASATWSGVLENGAGFIPRVIRPITNPGRTSSRCTPLPYRASASPEANPSRPAFAEP